MFVKHVGRDIQSRRNDVCVAGISQKRKCSGMIHHYASFSSRMGSSAQNSERLHIVQEELIITAVIMCEC